MENANYLVSTLKNADFYLRLGLSLAYGASLLLAGYTLSSRGSGVVGKKNSQGAARFFFYLGTLLSISAFTVLYFLPDASRGLLVNMGIGLVLAIATLFYERGNKEQMALSFLACALILFLNLISPFLVSYQDASTPATWLLKLHILTAILGEGLFVLAFVGSLLYLWDYRNLKSKWLRKSQFFPSLEKLDRLTENALFLGLVFITTSLVSGIALFTQENLETSFVKVLWAFGVWFWYVFCIFGREMWGWRGRRGAVLSLWGMLIMGAALFGTLWNFLVS